MKSTIEKQILEWKEELKVHKERLDQAKVVVEQENRLIAMIEGGIQASQMLLKKTNEQEEQVAKKEKAEDKKQVKK